MISANKWNGNVYDKSLDFVSKYGKELLILLEPQHGETILDLGCGTGDLAAELAKLGCKVVGIDASSEMLQDAKAKYPHISFIESDAHHYVKSNMYDKVLSNAAMHWMKDIKTVIKNVYESTKPGGTFVCEFGAKGNMQKIINAYGDILKARGINMNERNPWTFLPEEKFVELLKNVGFTVEYSSTFDRMTPLAGESGLRDWLHSFYNIFMPDFTPNEREEAYETIMKKTQDSLYIHGVWHADYKRLRVRATK